MFVEAFVACLLALLVWEFGRGLLVDLWWRMRRLIFGVPTIELEPIPNFRDNPIGVPTIEPIPNFRDNPIVKMLDADHELRLAILDLGTIENGDQVVLDKAKAWRTLVSPEQETHMRAMRRYHQKAS